MTLLPPASDYYRLAEWQEAERTPVQHSEEPEVWRMVAAMWLQEEISFYYWGGSEPGILRQIIPQTVFMVQGYTDVYVEGYCPLRDAMRTFRMDRMHWLDGALDSAPLENAS